MPLLVVLQDEQIPPPDLVLLQQRRALHLDLLDLELMDAAKEGEDLALLLGADALWQLLKGKVIMEIV